MVKYNEAHSIRHTYEHIRKRLKDERVYFDHELTAIDMTVQAKQKDVDELLFLSGDANHAKEIAQQELQRARIAYEENRARRENQLRERHQLVKIRKQMLERHGKSEMKRKEILESQLQQDNVDVDDKCITSKSTPGFEDLGTIEEGEDKLDGYESAFRKIQEATGVSDINEVIKKVLGQKGTKEKLMALTKQNQAKIEELMRARDNLQKSVDELKYSGSANGQKRNLANEYEEHFTERSVFVLSLHMLLLLYDVRIELLYDRMFRVLHPNISHIKLERCRQNSDRIDSALISLKAGVKHLQDKIDLVREEIGREDSTNRRHNGGSLTSVRRAVGINNVKK